MFKMNKNKRLPEQIFTLVMWCIAVLFAAFLTGLGGKIIGDLPKVGNAPELAQYESAELKNIQLQRKAVEQKNNEIRRDIEQISLTLEADQKRYDEEKKKFDNWIQTRTATGNTAQDEQVIERTHLLDQLQSELSDMQQAVEELNQAILSNERTVDTTHEQALRDQAYKNYESARNAYDLKVFLWRLLITLPALALGAWLFAKKRQSRYWPFVWGFIFFALIVFFIELVPYLPSYGGYVRYIVGIVLTLVGGYYGIMNMQKYLRRKQEEELKMSQSSQEERRREFNYEQALGHLAKNVCPSCERPLNTGASGVSADYCVHCGLCVFKPCARCGTRCSTFFKFCSNCGNTLDEQQSEAERASQPSA